MLLLPGCPKRASSSLVIEMNAKATARSISPLRRGDIPMFLQALFVLPLTAVMLRLGGFKRCHAFLERWSQSPAQQAGDESLKESIRSARRAIYWAVEYGVYRGKRRHNCLPRSLTLWWLLRRQGIESELRIGTRYRKGQLQAHAWIEYEGVPLNAGEQVRQRFTVFDEPIRVEDRKR